MNEQALLLHVFLEFIKEKEIKSFNEAIFNAEMFDMFINKLNEYAMNYAFVTNTINMPFDKQKIQFMLLEMFEKYR